MATYADRILAELRDTKDHVINMQREVQGTLRIGASVYFGQYELPLIIKQFLKLYPKVQVQVDTGLSSEIFDMLLQEEIPLDDLPAWPRINYRAPKLALRLGYTILPRVFVRPNEDLLYTLDLTLKDGQPIKRRTWMLIGSPPGNLPSRIVS